MIFNACNKDTNYSSSYLKHVINNIYKASQYDVPKRVLKNIQRKSSFFTKMKEVESCKVQKERKAEEFMQIKGD